MTYRCNVFLVLLVTAFLSGCAVHSAGGVVPLTSDATIAGVVPDTGPPPCKGQKTYGQYASIKEQLSSMGGSLCIPTFGGLGGSITYPPASPSVGVSLTSSTTNYNGKLPSLHSGTPIFYLQLRIAGSTTFGQNAPAGGGLTGNAIKPGKPYTVYGQAKIFGFPVNLNPCYVVATSGKYGGVIGGVGTLLKGQKIPANTYGVIEIYPGKSASSKC